MRAPGALLEGNMKVLSLRVAPVAKALAVIYAVLGFLYVPTLLLARTTQMTVPFGVLGPLVHFNLNLHFPMPNSFLTGILCTMLSTVLYAISGWLTGAVAVVLFNFVAKRMGGIEATAFVSRSTAIDGTSQSI
jgi:hypothetical protein